MNTHHSPVIVLLPKESSASDPFDRWLEESRYRAWEATDVFQLLDQMSDFTVRKRPDVVFMHVGATTEEQDFARSLIQASAPDACMRVIDFVGNPGGKAERDLDLTLSVLATQLDHLIPRENAATS